MSEPFLGEIRMVGFNFAPVGWALCDGQIQPINQNAALFSLLGTFYGGNGSSTYALPNFQGSVAIHQGNGFAIGQAGGSSSVTLSTSNLPLHSHGLNCVASGGNQASPAGALPAIESTGTSSNYSTAAGNGQMSSSAIAPTGGGIPVYTMPPFLTVTFIIALTGVFPARN